MTDMEKQVRMSGVISELQAMISGLLERNSVLAGEVAAAKLRIAELEVPPPVPTLAPNQVENEGRN